MSKYSALPDGDLVRACRAGDVDAWNELVERFSRYVYAIAVRGFRLSEEDAEDVFQDVFTRIYLGSTHSATTRRSVRGSPS